MFRPILLTLVAAPALLAAGSLDLHGKLSGRRPAPGKQESRMLVASASHRASISFRPARTDTSQPAADPLRPRAWSLLQSELAPDGTPVWEKGWQSKCEVCVGDDNCTDSEKAACKQLLPQPESAQPLLQLPVQTLNQPTPSGSFRVSSVLYSPEVAGTVRNLSRTNAWTTISADPTSAAAQKLLTFDPKSIVVKEIWEAVDLCSDHLSCPVPVWDPSDALQIDKDNVSLGDISSWHKVVIDTTGDTDCDLQKTYSYVPEGSTAPVSDPVPIKCFHQVPASNYAPRNGQIVNHKTWSPGNDSFLILVGFHLITADRPDWTWATFWWSLPGAGVSAATVPHGRRDPPSGLGLPWSLYWMDTANSDSPPESDSVPRIVFNPYLEGTQVNGPVSNCMSCHIRAVFQLGDKNYVDPAMKAALQPRCVLAHTCSPAPEVSPFDPVKLAFPPTPLHGSQPVQTHFLWSIAIHQDPVHPDFPDHLDPFKNLGSMFSALERRNGASVVAQRPRPAR